MFDILFGWGKASKCKRLIRKVQCRIKILKNKRSTIVRHLRNDVAELLKHGHAQTAYDRVEQLFKDECLVAVYDLLENFCEFIIGNLRYIRRTKDCPNDINEAVSSIIFASARFGDLPELISIRKLFGERYGQRFATVALELLPGNLVNRQMQEKMCIKSVSNDEKSRLLEEILKSSLQSGPLLLEYSCELQQKLENKTRIDPVPGAETIYEPNDDDKLKVPHTEQEQKKHVHADLEAENKIQKEEIAVVESSDIEELEKRLIVYDPALRFNEEIAVVVESSSESLAHLPEEMIYLDDIQEFESPLSKEGNLQDQRLFKFRSSAIPIRGKVDKPKVEAPPEEQKSGSRSFRKNRYANSKRLRRRSVSVSGDAASIIDMECAIYYGESYDSSPNYEQKCNDRQKHHKKIPIKQQIKTYYVQEVPSDPIFIKAKSSLDENYDWDDHAPQKPTVHGGKNRQFCEAEHGMLRNPTLLISTCSGSSSSSASIEEKASYLRAMTMPLERLNDATLEGVIRWNSFPIQVHDSNRHVHPNLPDYDELAARFTALKKANLQCRK